MNKLISFFSSDSRPLYKADIYNAICLPIGYVIHFRYRKNDIEEDIIKHINQLRQKKGVVFFAKSHEKDSGQLALATENISIREVTIVDVVKDKDIEIIHFYLQLNDYCDYTIKDDSEKIPPKFAVSQLNIFQGTKNSWAERVNAVRNSFSGHLFFKIQITQHQNDKVVYPIYEPHENQCFFKLQDETEYILNVHFAQTENITKHTTKFPVLQIEDKTQQIDINIADFVDVGVNFDYRKIRMVTKSISNSNIDSFIIFRVVMYDHDLNTFENILQTFSITSRITKRHLSVLLFSLNSTIAVAAVGAMAIFVNDLKDDTVNCQAFLIALVFTSISSAMLYKMFNKK